MHKELSQSQKQLLTSYGIDHKKYETHSKAVTDLKQHMADTGQPYKLAVMHKAIHPKLQDLYSTGVFNGTMSTHFLKGLKKLKEDVDLDEAVLTIMQRLKRGQQMRKNEPKLKRARELAKKRLASQDKLQTRAYRKARELVKIRVAGKAAANYDNLAMSQKIAIDKQVEKKQALIKKIAARLLPKLKQAEQKRLQSYIQGKALENHGASETTMAESLNDLFEKNFNKIIILNRLDDKTKDSIKRKAKKSDLQEEVLLEVFLRGLATWTESETKTAEQIAFDRVNSFISKGKSYYEEDKDLALQEQKTISVDVHHVTKDGKQKTNRLTVSARNSAEAENKAKAYIRAKYKTKIHDSSLSEAKMSEEELQAHARKDQEVKDKYGHDEYWLTHKPKHNSHSWGYIEGHVPGKPDHVRMLSQKPKGGVRKGWDDEYESHSVPIKHLTKDNKKSWANKRFQTEQVEQLDELSKDTLTRYVKAAKSDKDEHYEKFDKNNPIIDFPKAKLDKDFIRAEKRRKGIDRAKEKLRSPEENEHLKLAEKHKNEAFSDRGLYDEPAHGERHKKAYYAHRDAIVSIRNKDKDWKKKSTRAHTMTQKLYAPDNKDHKALALHHYDMARKSYAKAKPHQRKAEASGNWYGRSAELAQRHIDAGDAHTNKADYHMSLHNKALDRLTKEEFEQLDELSPQTLQSYRTKAKLNKVAAEVDQNFDSTRTGHDAPAEASRKRLLAQTKQTIAKRTKGLASVQKRGLSEGKMKELYQDLKSMDNGNFKKKYGKHKHELNKPLNGPLEESCSCKSKNCKVCGNSQPDPNKRLLGTKSLVTALKTDTPGEVAESVSIGDHVHLGFGSKGGAGFKGIVTGLDGDTVQVKSHYSNRTFSGPKKYVTPDVSKSSFARKDEIMKKIYETHSVGTHHTLDFHDERTGADVLQHPVVVTHISDGRTYFQSRKNPKLRGSVATKSFKRTTVKEEVKTNSTPENIFNESYTEPKDLGFEDQINAYHKRVGGTRKGNSIHYKPGEGDFGSVASNHLARHGWVHTKNPGEMVHKHGYKKTTKNEKKKDGWHSTMTFHDKVDEETINESLKTGSKITVLSHSKGGREIPGEIIGKHEYKKDHYVVKTKNTFGGVTKLVVHKSMLKEEVKTAEKQPVVVPSYVDQYGNTIPAKTVMRKKGKKILGRGNVHDGK